MERPTATSARKKQATDINRAWTEDEDQKLLHFIQTHGHGSWRTLPERAGLHRCWKSCRVRWSDHLRPDLKRGNFGEDEEDLIIRLHALLGDRWTLIAGRLPGRTDVEVRNYWYSHIKTKLTSMGIDPQNHRPRQLLDHAVQSRSKDIHDDHEATANSDPQNHRPRQHLHRAISVQESTSREILDDHHTTAISDNDDEQVLVSDAGSIN